MLPEGAITAATIISSKTTMPGTSLSGRNANQHDETTEYLDNVPPAPFPSNYSIATHGTYPLEV